MADQRGRPKAADKAVPTSVYLPVDMREEVENIATAERRTIGQAVVVLIAEALEARHGQPAR